jgi:hypothetical protein
VVFSHGNGRIWKDGPGTLEATVMPHARISAEEIDRRGQDLYENCTRTIVEMPDNIGKQIRSMMMVWLQAVDCLQSIQMLPYMVCVLVITLYIRLEVC